MFFWFWKFSKNQNLRFLYFWSLKSPELEIINKIWEPHNTATYQPDFLGYSKSSVGNMPDFTDDNELLPMIKQHPQGTKKYLLGSICK
jgi:hypothetical protein